MTRRTFIAALAGLSVVDLSRQAFTLPAIRVLSMTGQTFTYVLVDQIHAHHTREIYDKIARIERNDG